MVRTWSRLSSSWQQLRSLGCTQLADGLVFGASRGLRWYVRFLGSGKGDWAHSRLSSREPTCSVTVSGLLDVLQLGGWLPSGWVSQKNQVDAACSLRIQLQKSVSLPPQFINSKRNQSKVKGNNLWDFFASRTSFILEFSAPEDLVEK